MTSDDYTADASAARTPDRSDEMRLRSILAALVARIDWHVRDTGVTLALDHACSDCVGPDGDMVKAGFRCSYHAAKAALEES